MREVFLNLVRTYLRLGDAINDLIVEREFFIESRGDPLYLFEPRDAFSIVWHISSVESMLRGQSLDVVEGSLRDAVRFLRDIVDSEGRSSSDNRMIEDMDIWFDRANRGEPFLVEELQLD